MKWIIDSISDNIVKCEVNEGNFFHISKSFLPENVKQGDVLTVSVSKKDTDERKSEINELMNNLFKD